jgi:septum formation protein
VADVRIILASSSPRRRELLTNLGIEFDVLPADIDETERPGEDPAGYVHRLALEKAATIAARHPEALVIAADTTVDLDGRILGKPDDAAHVRAMLRELSGRSHRVHTGVCVRIGDRVAAAVSSPEVRMVAITDAMIDWYIGTGEPFDKAGAYGMQGAAAVFVEAVQGSVSAVIGMPMHVVVQLLAQVGVDPFSR